MLEAVLRFNKGFFLGLTVAIAYGCVATVPAAEPIPKADDQGGHLITREEIAERGWRNAWEIVQSTGKLHFTESAGDERVTVMHRGVASVTQSNQPLLLVDGVRVGDLGVLQEIRASSILQVRLLSGLEADIGTVGDASAGVIEIETIRR